MPQAVRDAGPRELERLWTQEALTIYRRHFVALFGSVAMLAAPSVPSANANAVAETVPTSLAGSSWTWGGTSHCPWVGQHSSASQRAREVLARMTATEKITFVGLRRAQGFENLSPGDPRLCIPPFTLQDGPDGIAGGDSGVTQLPASLGIAASFDPSTARRYGRVLGAEARGKGIDAVQAPSLDLFRVPEAGRGFEGYGEDPYLVSRLGVAEIRGIQSTGVMAVAKHFTAYNQESDRRSLDVIVGARALHELYLAPFGAAVRTAHVAGVMCAYPRVDGTYACQDHRLLSLLETGWRFRGFVRSDLGAVHQPTAAFTAGLDLEKPAVPAVMRAALRSGKLPMRALDGAIFRVLREMFAFGLVDHPRALRPHARVTDAAHQAFALRAATESIVLLKDRGRLLPLRPGLRSLAVIGADAGSSMVSAGFGSAHVKAALVVGPLAGIRRRLGAHDQPTFRTGGAGVVLPRLSPADLEQPAIGDPIVVRLFAAPRCTGLPEEVVGVRSFALPPRLRRKLGRFGCSVWTTWVSPPATGLYEVSLTSDGFAQVSLGGRHLLGTGTDHGLVTWSDAVTLRAGRDYRLHLVWAPRGRPRLRLGLADASGEIARAVRAARHAAVAAVFVSDRSTEGSDRPSLELPGDDNALIAAVASANPRTVVVLDTGGPVLMPWLSKVGAVLEAWYPGDQAGRAIDDVLFGRADPSGRLPVTFPASAGEVPTATASRWPGIDGTVNYDEGLDIGYRWYDAHHVAPLFPFGYGLSYTRFGLGHLRVRWTRQGLTASVEVTNKGRRSGTDVVQAYLTFPPAAGEPPQRLVAFGRIALGPGASRRATLFVSRQSLRCFLRGRWETVPGTYRLAAGQSSRSLPLVVTVHLQPPFP